MEYNNSSTEPLRKKTKLTVSTGSNVSASTVPASESSDIQRISSSSSVALVNSLLKKADEYYRLGRVYDWNRNLTGAMMQYSLAANTIVDVQEMINTFDGEMQNAAQKYARDGKDSSIKWCENLRCELDVGLRHILGKVKQLQDTLRQVKGAAMWPVGQDANDDEDDESDCATIKPYKPDEKSCKNLWFRTLIGMQEQKDVLLRSFIKPLEYPNMFADVAKGLLLYGPPGTGKCLGRDTPVIMFDGTVKMVQDVVVGDVLMGDDSTPRNVLSTCSGRETLYKVIPIDGDPYIVNQSHILSLKSSGYFTEYPIGSVIDITLTDYLNQSTDFQANFKGYRVAVEFPHQQVPIDPYLLGYWLSGKDHQFRPEGLLIDELETNKHIPKIYLSNDRDTRMKLLSGLLDSGATYQTNDGYDIEMQNERLLDDAIRLCRSLGFTANKKSGTSQFHLSNQCIENKHALMTDIRVEKLDIGDYYGFVIDGNHRFLLGDFTVTHNTLLIKTAINELNSRPGIKVLFFTPTGADLKGKYFSETETKIKALFKCAAKQACDCQSKAKNKNVISIIFIDEVESVGGSRDEDSSGFMTTTVNALLQAMDGISSFRNVSVVAATNYPWKLDQAFLRRFSRRVYVPLPDVEAINALLEKNLSDLALRTKARPNLDSGSVSCKVIKDSSDPCSDDYGCTRPKDEDIVSETEWRKPEYANFFRYITPDQVTAFAKTLANDKYSNSDVANLWANVLSQVGEDGVKSNVFVKQRMKQRCRFLSVQSCSLPQIKDAITNKTTVMLDTPINSSITIGDLNFVHQYILPVVSIQDARFKGVYVLENDAYPITADNTDIPLLIHMQILVRETGDTELKYDIREAVEYSSFAADKYDIKGFEDLCKMPKEKSDQFVIDYPTLTFGNEKINTKDYLADCQKEEAFRSKYDITQALEYPSFKKGRYQVNGFADFYNWSNEKLSQFVIDYPSLTFKDNQIDIGTFFNSNRIKNSTRLEDLYIISHSTRKVSYTTFSKLRKALTDSVKRNPTPVLNNNNNVEQQKTDLFDQMVTAFSNFGSPMECTSFTIGNWENASSTIRDVVTSNRVAPAQNLLPILKKGLMETKDILQVSDGKFRSALLSDNRNRGNVKISISHYHPWEIFTKDNRVYLDLATIVGAKTPKSIASELEKSFADITTAQVLEEEKLTNVPIPKALKDNASQGDNDVWNELRKEYAPLSEGYRQIVRRCALNVAVSISQLQSAQKEISSTADTTSIQNLEQYSKNSDEFMKKYKSEKK